MNANFKFLALPERLFTSYYAMSDSELLGSNAAWINVDSNPGYPCRVTLEDAKVGERVLALSFTHHDVRSPYRASGAIFVREQATQANLDTNQIPVMLRHRALSVRAYNSAAMMIAAENQKGVNLERSLTTLFHNPAIEYIHIHNAKPGCYNCTVIRASI